MRPWLTGNSSCMMMTSDLLQQWIEQPEMLDEHTVGELRMWIERYPYFQSVRLLYLKNLALLKDASFGEELHREALFVADRRVLFHLIEGSARVTGKVNAALHAAASAVEEPGIDRTLSLIDAFLAQSPEGVQASQSVALDYTLDYTPYLLQDDGTGHDAGEEAVEAPPLRGQELIDSFIRGQQDRHDECHSVPPLPDADGQPDAAAPLRPDMTQADEVDESCFTETLAKIYIRQHRYEKALEIIKKLSLNYPKKNAYFADQIKFLEKLIINANSK